MEWNVYRYNCNSNKIEQYNIFEHGSFDKYLKKAYKECKAKEEFAERIKSELRYCFWSKSQHELIIEITEDNRIFLNPWVGCRNPEEIKIDVTDDTNFDWHSFSAHHTEKQIYKNKAKIDIFDQVVWNWEEFVDYAWNNRKE